MSSEKLKIRLLHANEIEARVGSVSKSGKGLSLLLYKDARCDMNILDEAVGAMNWQRTHTRDNANCIVSIWDSEKKQWISKEDTGTESFTEKEKGIASDSFKRACVNWGIGRELYSKIFIWVSSDKCNIKQGQKGNLECKDKFEVTDIACDENDKIVKLVIYNKTKKCEAFRLGKAKVKFVVTAAMAKETEKLIEETGTDESKMLEFYGVDSINKLSEDDYNALNNILLSRKENK